MFIMFSLHLIASALAFFTVPFAAAQSADQFWHEQYHGFLSMAAYGDYDTLCRSTFTVASLQQSFPGSTATPWQVLERFGPTVSGAEGFTVSIPEMDKIVVVFKGLIGWELLNMTAAPITALNVGNCDGCTAHAGALAAYLEVKTATNDFAVARQAVLSTGYQFSVTGHGFGGMLSLLLSLDLGWRNLVHWSHAHGAPRVFNPAAAAVYNRLFQGEAGQRVVANEDSVPEIIPESDSYTNTLSGFHIEGDGVSNSTFGLSYTICMTDPRDPACLGGTNKNDHWYYYTPVGTCGRHMRYNVTAAAAYEASVSVAFRATATATFNSATAFLSTTTSSSSTLSSSSVETTSTPAPQASTSATNASPSATPASGAETRMGGVAAGLVSGLVLISGMLML